MSEQQANRDAEVALLAACMWSKTARSAARRKVMGSDFYWPPHEQLWNAMGMLDRTGRSVDAITLQAVVGAERGMAEVMLAVTTSHGMPESVPEYAAIVHAWSVKRRVGAAARDYAARASDPNASASTLAAQAATTFAGIRDSGGEDTTALSLAEVAAVEEESPTWVIPDLLERGDRVILTGYEGAGKSALSRQIAVMASAGLHPFDEGVMPPARAVFIDAENKVGQVARQTRPLLSWLKAHGSASTDPSERVFFDCAGRLDLLHDRGLSRIHRLLDAALPDIVVIGPLYRCTSKSLNDEETAAAMLAALDTITERGCALIVEAHAGHGQSGEGSTRSRDMRPRGSSSLMGWPEFGMGLRPAGNGFADLQPWRGHRENRSWPVRLRRGPGHRWVPTEPF